MKFFSFGKKKEDEQEVEQGKLDLDISEKRKRKKEEIVWTKKERWIVFIVFILTVGSSVVLALSSRSWKLPGFPRLRFDLSKISIFNSESITLEGGDVSSELSYKSSLIQDEFVNATKNLSGVYSIYVSDLKNGYSFGVNEDEIFPAASLVKLPVMMAMLLEQENGFDLTTKYRLKNDDKVAGAGSLYNQPEGYEVSYENLLRLMGKQSDNSAFNVVRKYLGEEKISKVINKAGMTKTSIDKNTTSSSDIGALFESLYWGSILNDSNKNRMISYLTDTLFEDYIPKDLPVDVRVAHKYGALDNVINDAGIVFSGNDYVLVLLGKGIEKKDVDDLYPKLSVFVYKVLNED